MGSRISTVWDLISVGFGLILVGFGIVIVVMLTSTKSGEAHGAGVVMIGPLPIVFGSDAKWASVAIALAAVLAFLTLLLYVV